MDSNVLRKTTEEQREAVLSIPSFLTNREADVDLNEIESAILNNVPGTPNTVLENQKDLKEFERMCKNWSPEYKEIAAHNLDSLLMLKVIWERMRDQEDFIATSKSNVAKLEQIGL